MIINYKNKKIEKNLENYTMITKEYGRQVADELFKVINYIKCAESLSDVKQMSRYNLHKLKGDMKNKYSIYILKNSGKRLIFNLLDDDKNIIETNESIDFKQIKNILVLEISDHYKK